MRFRLVDPTDFPTCRLLLNPAMRLSGRVLEQLPIIWRALAVCGTFSVVEDPIKAYPDRIEGFGASVFVTDRFVEAFAAERRNYLDAAVYERILDGPSPVLSDAQIGAANSGDGLNLVVLNYGLRDHDLANPVTQRVVQLGGAAFYALHAGYRIKRIMNEVFGPAAAHYLTAGGFRRRDTAGQPAAGTADSTTPHLFELRREWVEPAVINPLSALFFPAEPRIGFSPAEQRVLVHALLNRSDSEVAEHFGLSDDAVKKTWRRIYDRVSRRLPYVIPDDRRPDASGRSTEKRRHVLDYLRAHPEEVRPHRRRTPS
jgi:hypothetical protein